jgi:hypothetical protein
MSETSAQYYSRVSMEDADMSREHRHNAERKAGRVTFTIEAPDNPIRRWSVLEKTSEGQSHYGAWFKNEAEAEQFIINEKLKLGIK